MKCSCYRLPDNLNASYIYSQPSSPPLCRPFSPCSACRRTGFARHAWSLKTVGTSFRDLRPLHRAKSTKGRRCVRDSFSQPHYVRFLKRGRQYLLYLAMKIITAGPRVREIEMQHAISAPSDFKPCSSFRCVP